MTSGRRAMRWITTSALLTLFAASGAHAITIVPPVTVDDYTVSMQVRAAHNGYPPDPGVVHSSDQLGSLSLGFGFGVEAFGLPEPSLFADVSVDPSTSGGSGAELTVYYEVVGPPGADVPVVVTGTLEAGTVMLTGATGDSVAQIERADCLNTGCSITSGLANFAECSIGLCDQTVAGTLLHFNVLSNTEFGLYFLDGVTIQNTGSDLATGFAAIDPVVSFDPNFSDAGEFQIFLSDGIGNGGTGGGTVPEPGTFALAGIALTAATILRRRQSPLR